VAITDKNRGEERRGDGDDNGERASFGEFAKMGSGSPTANNKTTSSVIRNRGGKDEVPRRIEMRKQEKG